MDQTAVEQRLRRFIQNAPGDLDFSQVSVSAKSGSPEGVESSATSPFENELVGELHHELLRRSAVASLRSSPVKLCVAFAFSAAPTSDGLASRAPMYGLIAKFTDSEV